MPAVSVIMPAYNMAAYVCDAVRSVLAQTFTDFELLFVDDGSTDGTQEIAMECAAGDPRVRVLRKENGGISSARNAALRHARGRLLALLDSDDLWEPGYLEAQVQVLERHPEVAIVTGNAWFLGGAAHGRLARPCPDPRPHPDLANILLDERAVFIMCVLRREVYDTIGGFDESLRTNEDFDYWLRAALAGFRIRRNDQPLGRYRRRDNSLSANEVGMLRGALRVLAKNRPALYGRPELTILDHKFAEWDTRRLAAEARLAIESGDGVAAAEHLGALKGRAGGARIRLAWLMARWTPGLLARVYQLRRGTQGAAP